MTAAEASENTYFSDTENAGEMARLLKQARAVTRGMGGPFPPTLEIASLRNILDLACGPGEWVLHVAQNHPSTQVTGVDLSQMMVTFARNISTSVPNAHFQSMDILQPLDFPDASFDLIHARFIFGFMKTSAWPALLRECWRILQPGGVLILTEAELTLSNSPASEQLNYLFAQALYRAGQSFSPDGRHIGIIPMLGQLLTEAGFTAHQQQFFGADLSAGTERHRMLVEDYQVLFHLVQPFLLKTGVTTQMELVPLYHQMMNELQDSTFRAFGISLRIWGYK